MSDIESIMGKILDRDDVFSMQISACNGYGTYKSYSALAVLKNAPAGKRTITSIGMTAESALKKLIEKLNDNRDE